MVMGRARKSGVLSLHGNNTVVIYLFIYFYLYHLNSLGEEGISYHSYKY